MPVRKTRSLAQVLAALLEDPAGRHWGYELSKRAGVRSGVLYPILHRLLEEGWLEDGWEDALDTAGQRPPRRYYELTPEGRDLVAELVQEMSLEARFGAVLRGAAT
jgi:PadR family transcriptional regulator PadR